MRRRSLVALAVVALVAAGCSTADTDAASRTALQALSVQATTTTTAPAAAAPNPACSNPTASLAPQGPPPAAGAMPAGSFMAKIQARGRLIVGVDQDTYLFGYLDPQTGQIEGFDIDMLRQVATAIFGPNDPNDIQFVAISSAQRIPFVQSGQVDIVADTMTINCARDQQVDFSTVYYDAGQRILVPVGSPITSSADLGHQRVCAAAGSTSIENILDTGLTHAPAPAIPVTVTNWTDCLVDLEAGTIAAISTDDTILAGLAIQDPTTMIVGPKFTDEPYGMAINQDHPDFVRFVNGVLAEERANGTWAAIYNKWLSKVFGPAPAPPVATYGN